MKVTREEVIALAHKAKLGVDPTSLRDDLTLNDQGVDSIGVFSLILLLQEAYKIEIPDEAIDHLTSIPSVVDYLNAHVQ